MEASLIGYSSSYFVVTEMSAKDCVGEGGQQQQQQQHFISPHNIQEIKIYNNSTDDDRGAGCPK